MHICLKSSFLQLAHSSRPKPTENSLKSGTVAPFKPAFAQKSALRGQGPVKGLAGGVTVPGPRDGGSYDRGWGDTLWKGMRGKGQKQGVLPDTKARELGRVSGGCHKV